VLGWGSGAFAHQYELHHDAPSARAVAASHTIPVTVAAEQGLIGLAAYVVVLVAAFRLLLAGLGQLRGPPPQPLERVACAVIAAQFAGLVVHTLLYAAFLEDPLTWTLLGIGLGARVSAGAGPTGDGVPSGDARRAAPVAGAVSGAARAPAPRR
jgi:O-antigen ligase